MSEFFDHIPIPKDGIYCPGFQKKLLQRGPLGYKSSTLTPKPSLHMLKGHKCNMKRTYTYDQDKANKLLKFSYMGVPFPRRNYSLHVGIFPTMSEFFPKCRNFSQFPSNMPGKNPSLLMEWIPGLSDAKKCCEWQ